MLVGGFLDRERSSQRPSDMDLARSGTAKISTRQSPMETCLRSESPAADKLVSRTLPGWQPVHPSQIMIFPICGDHARHPYKELWVSALRHRTMMNGYHGVKDKVRNKQPPPRERANELLSLYSSFLSETGRLMSPVLGRWDRLPLERVLELCKMFPVP